MIDLYTRTILTVIAVALCVIAAKGPAVARGRACVRPRINRAS
jgi:hypothetical protein